MPIQPEDIVKKEFSRAFIGYDVQEVDLFLDAVIDRVEKLEAQRREMILAMEYLLKRLEHAGELTPGVKRALGSSDRALRRLILAADQPARDPEPSAKPRKRRDGGKSLPKRSHRQSEEQGSKPDAAFDAERGLASYTNPDDPAPAQQKVQPHVTHTTDPVPISKKAAVAVNRSPFRVGHTKPAETVDATGTRVSQQNAPDVSTEAGEELFPAQAAETVQVQDAAFAEERYDDAAALDTLIPELMRDLETAFSEGALHSAADSQQDIPARAQEDGTL